MLSPVIFKLLVALLILTSLTFCSIGTLLILRRLRERRKEQLLPHHATSLGPQCSQHCPPSVRGVTSSGSLSQKHAYFASRMEKQGFINVDLTSPPHTPLPEIRIHYPEEVDDTGKQAPGKVVIVKFGEGQFGSDPVEEDLPPYQPLRNPYHIEESKEMRT